MTDVTPRFLIFLNIDSLPRSRLLAYQGGRDFSVSEADELMVLITKARGGDRGAFDKLVASIRPRLLALIGSRLGPALRERTEVDDVLQETLLRAFRSMGSFRPEGPDSLLRWMGGIAQHVIVDLARKRSEVQVGLEGEFPGGGLSASQRLRRLERFDRLREALEGLSPDHRQVILLARIEGLPIKEIAGRMGRSPKAVTQLLMRALKNLRESFGDTESLHLPRESLLNGNGTQHGPEKTGR